MAKNLGFKKGDSKAQAERKEGEFDDLISALRTGDVFGDHEKFKRSRKTRVGNSKDGSGSNTSPPRHSASSHREESRERTVINLRHN